MVLANLALFFIAAAVMVKSGALLVNSLTRIAGLLKIKEFVIAFILMAFSTTIPELFVGITSALNKTPNLALGTAIGSNIVNISLIVGIAVLLNRGMTIDLATIRKDLHYMLVIATLPVLLLLDGILSRADGLVLLGAFLFYVLRQLGQAHLFTKRTTPERGARVLHRDLVFSVARQLSIFFAALLALFISARFVVQFATAISADLHVPDILIGLVVVALGTSLPELTFAVRAALSRQGSLAMGDLVGAVVINSTLVLGVTALIFPITAQLVFFFTSAVFMLLVIFIFITFAESGGRLSAQEGLSLVLLYLFFIMVQFYLEATV